MALVRRVGPASAFKVGFVLYGVLGLVVGALCSAIALAGIPFGPHAHLPRVVGLFAIILAPIFYGLIGGIGAAIGAFIYNLAADWVGGLELEIN